MTPEIRRLLSELEQRGREHDAKEPDHSRRMLNLEPATAELVSILAQSSRARNALEIGTSNGYSTIWLAASIAPSGGRVTSIDRNPEKHRRARENLTRAGLLDSVDLRTGDATEMIAALSGPFDFVFFDADRISAPAQLSLLAQKLARPALILADNALSHPDQIAGYLAAIQALDFQHVVVPVGKGLSIAYAS
ncbi:MAG TPA: class I SAM-dependent methyltransferase [Bryobacteraceae bacterium]|nr:class I SAM-dependent methyltransferase [Bryobacteraceae bacterium]